MLYGQRRGMRTIQFEELLCFPAFSDGLRQQSIYFTRNLPSIRSLNSCIFVRQHLICELVLLLILSKLFMDVFVHERWILGQRREGLISRPAWTVIICIIWSVSIGDDSHNCRQTHRSAGGTEYTQTVTLKRTYIIVAAFWVVILVPALCFVLDPQIIFWWGSTGPPLKIIISIASHTKIFHVFIQHHANVQDHVQPPSCQANTLNIVRYRRTVYSVLWVQFALVALYVLYHLFR